MTFRQLAGLLGLFVLVAAMVIAVLVIVRWNSIRRFKAEADATVHLLLDDAGSGDQMEIVVNGGSTGFKVLTISQGTPVTVEARLFPELHALNSYGGPLDVGTSFDNPEVVEIECEYPLAVDRSGRIVLAADWTSGDDVEGTCRLSAVRRPER